MKHKLAFLRLFRSFVGRSGNRNAVRTVCLALFLSISFSAYSQITISFKEQPLRSALKQIEQVSAYKFFYNESLPDLDRKVSLNVQDATIDQTMRQLLAKTALSYKQEQGNVIALIRKPAQNASSAKKITGIVVDANGEPIIGATVMVKGASNGGITDVDGVYSLMDVPGDAMISISYVGYKTVDIKVTDKSLARVILKEDTEMLDEVVVVGYGVQKKSDITGSVSSVKSEELLSAPNTSTAQALQGRVSGVVVQNTSGDPAGAVSIRIRGSNSLTYGNDPLVIIDGVQDGNIGSLNPNQIQSIEVLKDAAALSVYGSKGANGVILVTTKNGTAGKARISYNGFVSFDQVRKKLPSLNATDYATLLNEARIENGQNPIFMQDEIAALGEGTNWQNEIFREAISHTHNVSVSGGKEGISYFLAGGYVDKQGVVLNTDFREYTFRSNFKIQANKRLSFILNTFASYNKSQKGEYEQAISSALQWSPTKKVYDSESEGGYTQPGGVGPTSFNPVGYAKEFVNDNSASVFNVAVTGEYKFWDFLKFSTLFSYKTNSRTSGYFDNQVVNNGPTTEVSGSKTQSNYIALQSTSILTFDKSFGKHNVQATGVYEMLKDSYDGTTASAKGIPMGLGYNGIQFGSILQQPWAETSKTTMQSFMGRVNYSYQKRYMLSASVRYDGASQLAEGHKYDGFTAFSVGWNLMEEAFMERFRHVVPEFKLRASYGTVGNAAVPSFASQLKFTPGLDANNNPTLAISQLSNENLKWERTNELNVGIDSRWWGGRLSFSAEYYKKKTTDLLMWQKVPTALGVESILTNVGAVSNRGFDLTFGGIPVSTKNFKWDINYTVNYNKNKILELDGLSDMMIYTSNADFPGLVGSYVQMVGQPMGTFLGYTFAGVWKQNEATTAALYGAKPGDAKYADLNRDGKIDKEDIGIIGNAQPTWSFGFNNTFTIYDFDLNIFWQGVAGNDVYNQNRVRREVYSSDAFPTNPVIKEHWTQENETDIPSFSGTEYVNSSRWVEKGAYLRLKNITLGYRLPRQLLSKIGFNAARIYVSANNLWTITNYTGYDPEASMGTDATAAGVDRGIYPSAKSFLVGLDITF